MQRTYMDQNHPDAFVDYPGKMERDSVMTSLGYTKECPVCKGYGGWNLELNAYKLHDYEDTAENRHRYSHFRANCGHCNGWGVVSPEEQCSGHEWKRVKNLGNCYNRYECIHCGQQQDVDSSD